MPHLTLEYSHNLAPRSELTGLLKVLHETIGKAELVDIETLKSRLVEQATYFIGADTSTRAFLYGKLEVLPGRGAEWKKEIGQKLQNILLESAKQWTPPHINCSINFEVRELAGEFYFRTPPPKPK